MTKRGATAAGDSGHYQQYPIEEVNYSISSGDDAHSHADDGPLPYLEIIEQPCEELRFRYSNENGRAVIHGRRQGSHPKVKLRNYTGRCCVVASLVTDEDTPQPHPHTLVGNDCEDGVWTKYVSDEHAENHEFDFNSVGLIAMKIHHDGREMKESLLQRQKLKIDPFRTQNFTGENMKVHMNCVKICFEAYIVKNGSTYRLKPVVTTPIKNLRAPKVQREIAGENIKILRVVPSMVSSLYPSEICLLTSPLNGDSFEAFFVIDQDVISVPVRKENIHNDCAIAIQPPRCTAVIREPLIAKVFLKREGSPNEEKKQCSSMAEFKYEPSPYAHEIGPKTRGKRGQMMDITGLRS